jgi:hypothetical protein
VVRWGGWSVGRYLNLRIRHTVTYWAGADDYNGTTTSSASRKFHFMDNGSHVLGKQHRPAMTTGNSSAFVKQADLLVTLSRTSMCKHSVFLPFLDVVKHVISEAIQDGEDGNEDSDEVDEDEAAEEWTEEGEEVEAESENESENKSEDDKINDYIRRPEYKVDGYKMGVKEFTILTERLPRSVDGFAIRYELFDSELFVRTRPSAPHERAAHAVEFLLMKWQCDPADDTLRGNTLVAEGSAGKPVLFQTSY